MAFLSMGPQPKGLSFWRTICTQTMPQELLFPMRKPTEPLLQGLRQKAGLGFGGLRCPWTQGPRRPGGDGCLPSPAGAPAAWLPAPSSRSSEVMLWPRGHPEPGCLVRVQPALGVVERRRSQISEGGSVSTCDGGERRSGLRPHSWHQSLMVSSYSFQKGSPGKRSASNNGPTS